VSALYGQPIRQRGDTYESSIFPNPIVLRQLYTGPVGAPIDPFAQQLVAQGYARWTATYTVRLLADLSRWLQRQTFTATDLNEQRVDEFLHDRYRCSRVHRDDRPILRQWLEHLRDQALIPGRVVEPPTSPHDPLACDFQHYLLHQRRLSPTTVRDDLETARCFLRGRFGTQPPRSEVLCSQDMTDFMWQQARRYSPARAKLLATALRSFFRLLFQRGVIANDLTHAVPTVPSWRLSSLPRFMNAEDVDGLVQCCDRSTPKGQRDEAILLLLARLGLRAGEVAALTLDDLDWDAGELLVRGKSARHDRLLLPHEVGEALAVYLRHNRPPSMTRQVFVRMRAPRRGFTNGRAVTTIVARALLRTGLNRALKGAHLLRHA
jgi:site-specific recombinase XerD